MLFSDESRFCSDRTDGRMKCYRRRGERYIDVCLLERDRFGSPDVMVWGVSSFHGRTELICVQGNLTVHRYRDESLAPVVLPFFNAIRNVTLFQHYNARFYTARVSIRYLDKQHVRVLPWPAFSPDLSPI